MKNILNFLYFLTVGALTITHILVITHNNCSMGDRWGSRNTVTNKNN